MSQRPRSGLPRLSGRPAAHSPPPERQNITVFRRVFDLIERLERTPQGPPANKAHPGAHPPERRR